MGLGLLLTVLMPLLTQAQAGHTTYLPVVGRERQTPISAYRLIFKYQCGRVVCIVVSDGNGQQIEVVYEGEYTNGPFAPLIIAPDRSGFYYCADFKYTCHWRGYGLPTAALPTQTHELVGSPLFTANGDALIYRYLLRDKGQDRWTLRRVEIATGAITLELPLPGPLMPVAVSPDQSFVLLYVSNSITQTTTLYKMRLDDGALIPLFTGVANGWGERVYLSPDGSQILLVYGEQEPALWVMDSDGGAMRAIATLPAASEPRYVWSISYSPDGQWIALQDPNYNVYQSLVLRPDGSEARFLAGQSPVWTPDGRYLLTCGTSVFLYPTGSWTSVETVSVGGCPRGFLR